MTRDLDDLRADRDKLDKQLLDLLGERLRRRALTEADEDSRSELAELLAVAEPRHMTHAWLRMMERHGLSLPSGLSFRTMMVEQSEARQLGAFRPGWLLDRKDAAYPFVDRLKVRRPKLYQNVRPLAEVQPRFPAVLKPARGTGSRGVYLAFGPKDIRHVYVKDARRFRSWDRMISHASDLLTAARPVHDEWMVEELILEDSTTGKAARNLKFYCFYGKVLFIQESQREPDLQVTFWSSDGRPIRTGRYEEYDFIGVGVTKPQIDLAARISKEIPTPFMRIDMLLGEDGLAFGEFTPRPGRFQLFSDEWDRRMGEAWVQAEGQIVADVLAGKRFRAFARATRAARDGMNQG